MTGRDRIVAMALVVLAVAAAGWMLLVKPERKEADKYAEQVSAAQKQLATAQSELASAQTDRAQYAQAYASVVNLGKAVPPSQEVASLVYQLEQASDKHAVEFNSIVSASSGSTTGASTATATASTAGFTQMPFTFVFNGGFFSLERLFRGLTAFTTRGSGDELEVSGRLLTIQSVKLAPEDTTGAKPGRTPTLVGTVTATAYVLPAGQGLTGGATATSPTGGTTATSGTGSTTTAPAMARVLP